MSPADAVPAVFAEAANEIVRAVAGRRAPLVLIDGRSGAGKTTLSRELVARWPGEDGLQRIALDDVYPGWDGLHAAVVSLHTGVLLRRTEGRLGHWRRWDWDAARTAEVHAVDPALPLVVEGSGILTADTAALADLSVWLRCPAARRRERALTRDGEGYRPHWERWAAQEEEHLRRDDPESHADLVYDVP